MNGSHSICVFYVNASYSVCVFYVNAIVILFVNVMVEKLLQPNPYLPYNVNQSFPDNGTNSIQTMWKNELHDNDNKIWLIFQNYSPLLC